VGSGFALWEKREWCRRRFAEDGSSFRLNKGRPSVSAPQKRRSGTLSYPLLPREGHWMRRRWPSSGAKGYRGRD
jgi:hypothetical protein